MPVEAADYIKQLNKDAPQGGESISEGDDHIRAIKTAVRQSFPNIDAAVTTTPAELNAVPQLKTDLDTLMAKGNGIFASCRHDGTNMLYENNVATVDPIGSNAGYKVTFTQPAQGFDQYYAVLSQSYASNGKHAILTVTGQTNSYVDIAIIEFDFVTQQWQLPENPIGFSLVLVDMQQV